MYLSFAGLVYPTDLVHVLSLFIVLSSVSGGGSNNETSRPYLLLEDCP